MVNNNFGFLRVFLPKIDAQKADIEHNTQEILSAMKIADREGVGLLVLPPFSVTSPNCGSLFFNHHLLDRQNSGIKQILKANAQSSTTIVMHHYDFFCGRLIQKLSIIQKGAICSSVALNNATSRENEFFSPSHDELFSDKLFFDERNQITIGANKDADIQILLDSQSYTLGKSAYYKNLSTSMSLENNNITILNSSNGISIVSENGVILDSSSPFEDKNGVLWDVDANLIKAKRLHKKTFTNIETMSLDKISPISMWAGGRLIREVSKLPFIPSNREEAIATMEEIFHIQVNALSKRLAHTHSKHSVVGVSGGLDSTLALLVSVFAHKKLGLPLENIIAITMPGFGTTGRTYNNAVKMIKSLGVTFKEISIKKAVMQHFEDINHSREVEDITFENSQARERTQILMDYANKVSGLVIGTGDLSELALGWCTYNGDHMSMYGVNSGIPKTLMQYVIRWFIDFPLSTSDYFLKDTVSLKEALEDVLATPISPELLSPNSDGNMSQKTEDKVGPYPLHDFFIYHTLLYGAPPKKLLYLATKAFEGQYDEEFVRKWLKVFYKRFFTQQFKRNCSPDSPVIMSDISLNYDKWLMDSDIHYNEWLLEL